MACICAAMQMHVKPPRRMVATEMRGLAKGPRPRPLPVRGRSGGVRGLYGDGLRTFEPKALTIP